ncbi:MAG: hypothetical protein AAFM91_05235 [Pseudomonadota bacterium]
MAAEHAVDNRNLSPGGPAKTDVVGEFVELYGERYYAIRNVDKMAPFFISVVSSDDHWLFVSSNGGLTAGRVSPETALFPYITVDRIHDSTSHTGSITMLRVQDGQTLAEWDPFSSALERQFDTTRNLYKNTLGNKLCFEEINHDLDLVFRYTWQTCDRYGFVRFCEIENTGGRALEIEILDGLQNILPAGTPRFTQTNSSNLVNAYKWTEFDPQLGLALFTLYSGITDRAEPCESLKANTAYVLGLDQPTVLLSAAQIENFRSGQTLETETLKRGIRGAFLVASSVTLGPAKAKQWQIVANTEQTQLQVVALRHELSDPRALSSSIENRVQHGSDRLARIMAGADAFQSTAEEIVGTHHYANVLFNSLRGGVFADQYRLSGRDVRKTIADYNRTIYERNRDMLDALPNVLAATELAQRIDSTGDKQLQRLCYEYLPITFGRRHGDPSRPWNQFAIQLRDSRGETLLSYEGNWRDIFQNWEALAFSYPEFIENLVAKFVNASTMDGYNPYRITKEGIDWEVEDPEDPWSYIGYWGDHQIIYLQKLLEQSRRFHPQRLGELLHKPIFCYANVPYRIRPFAALLENPKETVDYDDALAARIEERTAALGADGKLVLDQNGDVYQVCLVEKLLVPLLAKLGNLVVDGGIWMNTQRPEWNDANNALVGQGLSMVTLFYLRRYVCFLDELLADDSGNTELSIEIAQWLEETAAALRNVRLALGNGPIDPTQRRQSMTELGEAAERFREAVYRNDGFTGKTAGTTETIRSLLTDALAAIDQSVAHNRRDDGLYHAYNLLDDTDDGIDIARLYPMLEGQVAALSSGALTPRDAIGVVEALYASKVYRPGQNSFMLYPDRELPSFLDKNRIPAAVIDDIPLLREQLDAGDDRLVIRDADGDYRFNAALVNSGSLADVIDELADELGEPVEAARDRLAELYESVFDHQAFTGRSGTMFGFEGLGCIYWHMVAKLLLAVQENFLLAADRGNDAAAMQRLGDLYYQVRSGIGFNKTPTEFGAFPADPYSHTPKHAGARQPGMTGQVKEEVLTRFGELGVRVANGVVRFAPLLLRAREFADQACVFRFVDVDDEWQEIAVPAASLAFTWCQIPIVYTLNSSTRTGLALTLSDGSSLTVSEPVLPTEYSAAIFERSGRIRRIDVDVDRDALFTEADR